METKIRKRLYGCHHRFVRSVDNAPPLDLGEEPEPRRGLLGAMVTAPGTMEAVAGQERRVGWAVGERPRVGTWDPGGPGGPSPGGA